MGQLIITNFGGWIGEEIRSADCGFSYKPEDTAAFTQEIQQYIDSPTRLALAKRNARYLAESKYEVRQQCEHLENFILSL
jgi:glycosyltransferase involved in cell wall biosynthesis